MCGIEMQKAGISTCIFDRAIFPREKLCGGLLTQKTVDLLKNHCRDIRPEEYITEETNSVEFYYEKKPMMDFRSRVPFYFTERTLLDDRLIKQYKKLGGTVFENIKIHSNQIDLNSGTIRLDAETFKYEVLVGAYGCGHLLTRLHHINLHRSFCVEGKAEKDSTEKTVRIYFGLVMGGYGWDFPKKDHFAIGILEEKNNRNIRNISDTFFREVNPKEVHSIRGAFIPSGQPVPLKKLPKNVLLVGDAAGFIDPITGEGIYYALLSGIISAESILQAIRTGNDNFRDIYFKNTKKIRKNIQVARSQKAILYNPFFLKHFMNFIRKHRSFALFYVEEVMSKYKYRYKDFVMHFLVKRFIEKKRWE